MPARLNGDAPADGTLPDSVAGALALLPARAPLVLAHSGGLDSQVLLDVVARRADAARWRVVHVHHGLLPQADAWAAFSRSQARARGLLAHVERITVDAGLRRSHGLEAAARVARHAALAGAARRHGAAAVVLAHHFDDQIETVRMRRARGAGPTGRAGMSVYAPGPAGVPLLRPLLDVPRDMLRQWARAHALAWVDDPSNDDPAFLRTRVRRALALELARDRRRVLDAERAAIDADRRAAARETAQADDDLARICMPGAGPAGTDAGVGVGGCAAAGAGAVPGALADVLVRDALNALPPERAAAALRRWLARAGQPAPSRARLADWQRQLRGPATRAWLVHGAVVVACHRNHVLLEWRDDPQRGPDAPLPALHPFIAGWAPVHARYVARAGVSGPHRDLKHVAQQLGIPPWWRHRLPVAWPDAAHRAGTPWWFGPVGPQCPDDASPQCGPTAATRAALAALRWTPPPALAQWLAVARNAAQAAPQAPSDPHAPSDPLPQTLVDGCRTVLRDV